MKFTSIKFRKYRCFQDEWSGFDEVKPVTVIIGRNNVGKSHLLHLVEWACENKLFKDERELLVEGILDEASLISEFPKGASGGELGGSWWNDHGSHFVNVNVSAKVVCSGAGISIEFNEFHDLSKGANRIQVIELRKQLIKQIVKSGTHRFSGSMFKHLFAERDIKTEPAGTGLKLGADGAGATNIIRRFITSSNDEYPRELIQQTLLEALNRIFAEDGEFTEIQIQQHDEPSNSGPGTSDYWEVYLGEKHKKLIALSNSGSGLKTVVLVLLNLLVIPHIEKKQKADFVYAFEELENNLHPALLRRLLRYLQDYVVNNGVNIFLTTHASTALDLFGTSPHAQIISVIHDGKTAKTAKTKTVSAHFDQLSVIAELGAKPSDLLQANGIIWVEGPSDRVYINKWIELFGGGKWREGRDYQCAFYGGALKKARGRC